MLPSNKLKLEKLAEKPLSLARNSLVDEKKDDLNSTLLKSLECGVKSCHRYLYPPIKQCRFVFTHDAPKHTHTHATSSPAAILPLVGYYWLVRNWSVNKYSVMEYIFVFCCTKLSVS